MSVEHRSHSRARDRSVVVSFTCDSEMAAVAEAATDTDSDTDTPTHTDTDTETDATRATRTARTDTHPHPHPHPHPHLSAQASSPITARFAGTSATRPTPTRIERTRLRAQIAALQTELESRTDQQQELITQYERLLEAYQEAAEDGDGDRCEDGTTGDSTAGSGSVLKRLGTGTGNGRGRTRVIRIRRRLKQWWRQLRR